MKKIKFFHLAIGVLTMLHFVITGVLLKLNFFSLETMDIVGRMMFRANHIYILFAGLLNLLIFYTGTQLKSHWLLTISSLLVLIASLSMNIAFYTDPITYSLGRELTRLSVFSIFCGTVIRLVYLELSPLIANNTKK